MVKPPFRSACSLLLLLTLLLLFLNSWHQVSAEEPSPSSSASALTAVNTDDDGDDGTGTNAGNKKDTEDGEGVSITIDSEGQKKLDLFQPSEEWQEVKEGQAIPPGLQVRLDLQTGQKQAKLMPGQSAEDLEYWKSENREGMRYKNKNDLTPDDLKQALKHFKQHKSKDQEDHASKVRRKKRDYEMLRSSIKSDAQIVTMLHDQLKDYAVLQKEDLQSILSELEFFLHQIDNAQLFAELGGISLLVNLLNSTDTDVKHDTAFVLGSAMQSNPVVQLTAVDAGVMQRLITMISTEPSLAVRKKCLYAASVLLRHNLYAQQRFLALGGLSAFTQLYSESKTEAIQVKIVTLLADLISEKVISASHSQDNNIKNREKLRQYESINLLEKMTLTGWCDRVASLLNLSDYDSQEKILTASKLLTSSCNQSFQPLTPRLHELSFEYSGLCTKEKNEDPTSDLYFCSLHNLVTDVLNSLQQTHKVEL
ncbi:nucleotide exchange factor SIL1 [Octopus bimaculoides]|uniref:Nucleotide exchange factor SIL1 n=1 Tax=Octopus bimaculoides TaxID=37653 RepID=A0A0L8FSA1_OCTBM|nr:nucleotide exchange factor SIL1 [Octopus bimaculoides]|eukprot:XP_014787422.1 PREDICTED: nucleotide exchange factor SIL1-like [Octopus bimaculoides]